MGRVLLKSFGPRPAASPLASIFLALCVREIRGDGHSHPTHVLYQRSLIIRSLPIHLSFKHFQRELVLHGRHSWVLQALPV